MLGQKPDENIRTPMQWSAEENAGFTTGRPWETIKNDYAEKNVAIQSEDPTSLLTLYRTLVNLRDNHAALRVGEFIPLEVGESDLMAFLRVSQEETILVIINLDDKPVSGYGLSLKSGPLSGTHKAFLLFGTGKLTSPEINSDGGFNAYQPVVEIPANSSLIIQLR